MSGPKNEDDEGNDNLGSDEEEVALAITFFVNGSTMFSKFFSDKYNMLSLLNSMYLVMLL